MIALKDRAARKTGTRSDAGIRPRSGFLDVNVGDVLDVNHLENFFLSTSVFKCFKIFFGDCDFPLITFRSRCCCCCCSLNEMYQRTDLMIGYDRSFMQTSQMSFFLSPSRFSTFPGTGEF